MDGLFDKISSYNIFNYLFPGVLFAVIVDALTDYHLIQENIIIGLFVYYLIGLVISRIGSLIIEPALKKVRFIKFADYGDYVKASEDDPKLDVLSETNNMYRTLCALLSVLLIIALFDQWNYLQTWNTENYLYIIFALLFMFLFSYRKQTAYIYKRINKSINEKTSQPDSENTH